MDLGGLLGRRELHLHQQPDRTMSDTPETDKFYEMIEDKCLPIDARYYHMRVHARKMELDAYEQCRLLGMSAERECDLRGKVARLESELKQLKQQQS